WISFPSYESLFAIGSNHILLRSELTGNGKADREKVLHALKAGQFYFSIDLLGNPKGFNAFIIDKKSSKIYLMGSEVSLKPGMELQVRLPGAPFVPFDIDIYRNGERILTSNSHVTQLAIHEPGVYRVRVRVIPTFPLPDGKKWIPWIYSNPFYVKESKM
ncbi:MAG: hypothetical protein KDD22_06020, partial [Bdellovibrionales bacterium]|nr:hypothetical protein [Bdellovibrionales bacterium]